MSVDVEAVARLAGTDRKAARQLLAAQQAQARAQAQIAVADADAARKLRSARQQQRLAVEHRDAHHHARVQAREQRRLRRAQRAQQAREQAAIQWARAGRLVRFSRGHADDAYAAIMYALAVGGAVFGQITAATGRGWPLAAGVVIAVAIEGLALVMALTAHKLRLDGEAARAPRVLTWVCAAMAAGINYLGHAGADRVGAVLLAALSLAGIVVWEIRSGAAHRHLLRRLGLLPVPPATFGARRWWRYPRSTFAAWSIDVRDRVTLRAATLLATAATEQHHRETVARTARVGRLARRAVRSAERRGDTPAVLTALRDLAGPASSPVPQGGADRTSAVSPAGPWSRAAPAGPVRADRTVLGRADRQVRTGLRGASRSEGVRSGPRLRPRRSGPDALGQRSAGPRVPAYRAGPVRAEGDGVAAASRGAAVSPTRASARPRTAAPGAPPGEPGVGGMPATGPVVDRRGLDVTSLLPAGRQIRDQLAASGIALSRSVLIKGLRERHIAISTDRAGALLAELRHEPPGRVVADSARRPQ